MTGHTEHTDRSYVYLVQVGTTQPTAFTELEFAEAYAERVGGSVVAVANTPITRAEAEQLIRRLEDAK